MCHTCLRLGRPLKSSVSRILWPARSCRWLLAHLSPYSEEYCLALFRQPWNRGQDPEGVAHSFLAWCTRPLSNMAVGQKNRCPNWNTAKWNPGAKFLRSNSWSFHFDPPFGLPPASPPLPPPPSGPIDHWPPLGPALLGPNWPQSSKGSASPGIRQSRKYPPTIWHHLF